MQASVSTTPILLAAQCRAGRALIEWSVERLAEESRTDVQTIKELEARFRRPDDDTLRRLRDVFETGGVVFIDENGGGGAGARLKLNRKDVRAINRWEGEGGSVGENDI